MIGAHSADVVRAAEEPLLAELPEGALMQRAAVGLAHCVARFVGRSYGVRVLLVVGSGNNGGDALWAGAHLARRGAKVEAISLGETHQPGLAAFLSAGGTLVSPSTAKVPDVVVDGVVGIGGKPGLRQEAQEVFAALADHPVVAVDLPSGLNADSGEAAAPHVRADLTVTFGTHKPCQLVAPASQACGRVELVDIGLELPTPAITALEPSDVAQLLRRPGTEDHKYTRGVLGIRAGSASYPGAAVLAVGAASTGLCGMVRYHGPATEQVMSAHPEVVIGPPLGRSRVQAWLVGCGSAEQASQALASCLAGDVPVVIDADALNHLPETLPVPAILTPHAGELATMLGVPREDIEASRLRYAREAASTWDAVVVLKGWHTLVADPQGTVRVTTTGTPWLGVAGAGDTLAGLIGALLASGLAPFDAASVGSWLHGVAAADASQGGPLTPSRVCAAIPDVVAELVRDSMTEQGDANNARPR